MHVHSSIAENANKSSEKFSLTAFIQGQNAVHFVAGEEGAIRQIISDWQATDCHCEVLSVGRLSTAAAIMQQIHFTIQNDAAINAAASVCFIVQNADQLALECILQLCDECQDQAFKVIFTLPSCRGEALHSLSQQQPFVSIVKLPDIRKTITVIQQALQKKNFSRYEEAYPLGLPPLTTIYRIHHACHGDQGLIQQQIHDWMKSDPFIATYNGRRSGTLAGRMWDSRWLHQGVGLAVVAGMSFGLWQQQKDDVLLAQNSQPHVVALPAQPSRGVSGQRFASHTPAQAKVYTIAVTRSRSPKQLRRSERRMHIPVKNVTLRKVSLPNHKRVYEMDFGRYASRQAATAALQRLQSAGSSGFA